MFFIKALCFELHCIAFDFLKKTILLLVLHEIQGFKKYFDLATPE